MVALFSPLSFNGFVIFFLRFVVSLLRASVEFIHFTFCRVCLPGEILFLYFLLLGFLSYMAQLFFSLLCVHF